MSVTKVKRYWPGKAPEWADVAFPLMTDCQISRKDDPRLRRLAESRLIDRAEVRAEHRRIHQAEIIFTEEEKEESRGLDGPGAEEEDEDAMEDRRRRIREKLVKRQEEEETAEYENETDSESEYETDSDTVKPAVLFVPKSERDTVTEREQMEAEEMALEAAARRRLEERKVKTKQIVVEKIREEQEMNQKEAAAEEEDVETDDELNEDEEYERWKAREIGRMTMMKKRDRGATESMAEDANSSPKKKQKRMWFLQKYYHKGAFFQSHADDQRSSGAADAIYTRDFSSPTGEDKMDKTILPKVMQVKHFGRSGRTKWTHLLDQDTTDWNNQWTYNSPLRTKYNKLMADMYKPIEKPKGCKKLKDCELRCVLLILAPDK